MLDETLKYRPFFVLRKYRADITKYPLPWWKKVKYWLKGQKPPAYDYERFFAENEPYEELVHPFNVVTNLGAQALWRIFAGLGTASAPSASNRASFFSSTNAYIGVGNGTSAASPTDTNLTGSSKYFKAMDAGYPQAPSFDPSGSRQAMWMATFGPTEANFTWSEVGLANADLNSNTNGILFNRANVNWGTKTSSDTWTVGIILRID